MSEADDIRRKRLRFQSWHRGMKEMDLVLGNFADLHIDRFSVLELDRYEELLSEEDADLWLWLTGREPVPEDVESAVWTLLKGFRFAESPSPPRLGVGSGRPSQPPELGEKDLG